MSTVRKVHVQTLCDVCGEEATTSIVLRAGKQQAEVDLCEHDTAEVIKPLIDLIDKGRKPDNDTVKVVREKPVRVICPACQKDCAGMRGLSMHLTKAHDFGVRKKEALLREAEAQL